MSNLERLSGGAVQVEPEQKYCVRYKNGFGEYVYVSGVDSTTWSQEHARRMSYAVAKQIMLDYHARAIKARGRQSWATAEVFVPA